MKNVMKQMRLSCQVQEEIIAMRNIFYQGRRVPREEVIHDSLAELRDLEAAGKTVNWMEVYDAALELPNALKPINTTLTMEEDDLELLERLRPIMAEAAGVRRCFLPFVIGMVLKRRLLPVSGASGGKGAPAAELPQTMETARQFISFGIDLLVFKMEYVEFYRLDPQRAERLCEACRGLLRKDAGLYQKLSADTSQWVRNTSDYYNAERYVPARKRLGTGNIIFFSKVLAGVLLSLWEVHDDDLDAMIEQLHLYVER